MGRDGGRARRRARGGAWKTVVSAAFTRDVARQVTWLVGQDREAWAQGLKQALRTARVLLERNPELNPADGSGLRRLLLGRLPLILWYRASATHREVVWLRLFHVRQRAGK